MLRRAISSSYIQVGARRAYASAAKGGPKRALSRAQLEGDKKKPPSQPDPPGSSPPPPPPPPGGSSTGNTTTTPPSALPAEGGSNAFPIIIGLGVLGAGVGYYYYNSVNPEESEASAADETSKESETTSKTSTPTEDTTTSTEKAVEEAEPKSVKGEDGGNRVLQIKIGRSSAPEESFANVVSHPEGGNRVTMESFRVGSTASVVTPVSSKVSVRDSLKELQTEIDQETSDIMKRANQEIMQSFDESVSEGLDDLSPSQLRARIVQLATEMKERTKWEALRLKEFLALKEKETADRYLDVLQKQRLEFESILARRLREQEHEIATQANAKLQEKDSIMKEMVDTALEKLGEEHEKEKNAIIERIDQQRRTQYEQAYMEKLEAFKTEVIEKEERKQQALEALTKKLKDLENALASSQNYHEGSLQAHKLSAAALALAEKMESNKGAEAELNALRAVAGRDNVIAAALESVPASIAKGVPTLPELQARFDKVSSKARQAAMIPAGQTGLEGQLLGMAFANMKYPPKPDDPPPENDKDAAEYLLVRARQHVQYGELEKAIQHLNKLDGQAAFTVQGWKKDATDRVAVEQALKVIKMECALLNETMSNHP